MYQSSALTASGRRSRTPAVMAAPAVVILSTPSAPNPWRRSHNAATRAALSVSSASTSGSSTKSFSVPWPLAKIICATPSIRLETIPAASSSSARITRSGYLPPCLQCGVDDAGPARWVGCAHIEPVHPVVPAKPRPLPSHVAAGTQERLLPRGTQGFRVTFEAGFAECLEHLGVAQRARCGDTVAQAFAQECAYLVDQALLEHRVGTPDQTFIENRCVTVQPDDDGVPSRSADARRGRRERLAGELDDLKRPHG